MFKTLPRPAGLRLISAASFALFATAMVPTLKISGVQAQTAKAQSPIKVVVTSKPIHSLVAQVMSGVGTPRLLIAGNSSPHTYVLKPSDASALSDASIAFRLSSEIEPFSDRAFAALPKTVVRITLGTLPDLKVLRQRQGATFERAKHGHDHGGAHKHTHVKTKLNQDGHVWLDPSNGKIMIDAIARALASADAPNAATYLANAEAAKQRLDALDAELAAALKPASEKPLVVLHDALQYFEARYGLNVVGSIQLSTEVPPSGRRLTDVRTKISRLGAVCVFREPFVDSKVVDVVAEGTSARLGEVDPEGTRLEAGPGLYDALLRGLAKSIADCALGTS